MNFKLWLENYQTSINGEYWIQEDGMAIGADGDIGDMTHEGYVIEQIIGEIADMFNVYNDDMWADWDKIKQDILEEIKDDLDEDERKEIEKELGYSIDEDELIISKMKEMGDANPEEKMGIINGTIDGRPYAMEHWGWKALRDNHIETWTLTSQDMKVIAEGIREVNYEISEEAEFYISVYQQNKNFTITLRELEAGRIGPAPSAHELAPSVAGRKIDQWNNALTRNAAIQGREAELKKLHPAYQNITFPFGDATIQ